METGKRIKKRIAICILIMFFYYGFYIIMITFIESSFIQGVLSAIGILLFFINGLIIGREIEKIK